jgi:hypothetical protein
MSVELPTSSSLKTLKNEENYAVATVIDFGLTKPNYTKRLPRNTERKQ